MQAQDKQTQYIARISHGKDSLKMLDVIVSRGLRLDRITTTDVWATNTIRGEHPKMVQFKEQADEYIWKKYRIEVEHLCATKDGEKVTYEKLFYHIPKCKGRGGPADRAAPSRIQGFPAQTGSWCKKLKIDYIRLPPHPSLQAHTANGSQQTDRDIVEYLGIAADEPKRFGQLNDKKRAPLVEFGIEEGLCGLYCHYEGILAPSYGTSCRDGCWMCHNQGVNQLRHLRKDYPQLWELLLKWDKDSPVCFHADGHTVHDFDLRFQWEDERLIFPGEPFRWKMLREPIQCRLF